MMKFSIGSVCGAILLLVSTSAFGGQATIKCTANGEPTVTISPVPTVKSGRCIFQCRCTQRATPSIITRCSEGETLDLNSFTCDVVDRYIDVLVSANGNNCAANSQNLMDQAKRTCLPMCTGQIKNTTIAGCISKNGAKTK